MPRAENVYLLSGKCSKIRATRMLQEFKAFIAKGNVLDLAVAVIIGGAFGAIVTSAVNDVIMPPIGLILGKVDFKELFVALDGKAYQTLADAKKAAAPVIAYGSFLNTVVNFLIVAFFVFLVVQSANKMKKPAPVVETVPTTKDCPFCASTIPIKAIRCPHCTSDLKGN
jgi:large conductance mechanosensitive channel